MTDSYETFSKKTRDKVSVWIVDVKVRDEFAKQLGVVSDMLEAYMQANDRKTKKLWEWHKTKEGQKHQKEQQEWQKARDELVITGPPPERPLFPEDDLPPHPGKTLLRISPPKTLTASEELTRFYALLAITHDGYNNWNKGNKVKYIRKDLLHQFSIVGIMWLEGIDKDPQWRSCIEEARQYVEKDLDKQRAEAETPSETRQISTLPKRNRLAAMLWEFYEKTLGVVVEKILDRMS